jgi:hypothetical protein
MFAGMLWLLLAAMGLIYLADASADKSSLALAQITGAPLPALMVDSGAILPAQTWITAQDTITGQDIVLVFDVSASVEDQTNCHDCWVRTSYSPDYPNNGYFNPLPYNPAWATAGTGNQAIPNSSLCTVYPPQPFITATLQYLTVEAELYSRNVGNWDLGVRTPGQGFWAIQRGSKRSGNNPLGEDNDQNNQAGDPTQQSSNVCRPSAGGIDCTVGGSNDDVCASADGGLAADCSAYIAARPFGTYGQQPGNLPYLNGAAYNADCFSGSGLSGNCWSSSPIAPAPGPSNVPWVEYDFTPVWTQTTTYIWIRATGGGDFSFTWADFSPDQLDATPLDNIAPWRKAIYWQVDNSAISQRKDNINTDYANSPTDDNSRHFQRANGFRDNRAENGLWRWIKLGSTATVSGTQYTLKLYQGSAGYKVDKIVFTNDSSGTTPEAGTTAATSIPAALRRRADGLIAPTDGGDALGPPASPGSATREACNRCNPAFGYTVNTNECTCRLSSTDTANGGYGAGAGCSIVLTTTNQLQAQFQTGLYSGLQPLRSAQEAVKSFAVKLNPSCNQLGFVPFTGGADNTAAQNDATRRSKLQCLNWAAAQTGNPARCYDPLLGVPLSYTYVLSAVEKHWPETSTDMAVGIREGLEELGVSTPGNPVNSNCTAAANDGSACDRQGLVRRTLILITDGTPNTNPGNCAPGGGRPDLWDGLIGTEDADFECAVYYAFLAAQNNVTVHTIGIGSGATADLLTTIATGIDPRGTDPDVVMFSGASGQYFPAAKPTDLDAIFDLILAQTPSCGVVQLTTYLPTILKD